MASTPNSALPIPNSALVSQRGFILPLSVWLVLILTISGTAFMHHDYLERRMAMNTVDNHGGFYLANAGIERARETYKIPSSTFTWTPMLTDLSLTDTTPDPRLCPDTSRGCVIPPFQTVAGNGVHITIDGDPVPPPDFPMAGVFVNRPAGSVFYSVRAYNNLNDIDPATGTPCPGPGTNDCDQQLVIRALGVVGAVGGAPGETKLLETTVLATANVNLINCLIPPCPSKAGGAPQPCDPTTNPTCLAMEGREPEVGSVPTPVFPITDPQNYYRDETGTKYSTNFPGLVSSYSNVVAPPGGLDLVPTNNTYYFVQGDVNLKSFTANNVIIFSTGNLSVETNVTLTNAILVAVGNVEFKGSGDIRAPIAPPLYPVVFAGGNVTKSSGSATVFGNIYAVGNVNFNPIDVHGTIFGNGVEIQGSSLYTDEENLKYYGFMKGFNYDNILKTTTIIGGSWREIQ